MKRFRFRLEPVLTLRRRETDVRRQAFAAALREHMEALRSIEVLEQAREEAKDTLRAAGVGPVEPNEVLAWYRHVAALLRREQEARARAAELGQALEARRQDLTKAMAAQRGLERLRERRLGQWRRDAEREEQRALDDLNDLAGGRAVRASEAGERRTAS